MGSGPEIHPRFEAKTCTWQYVVADPQTREAVIIDSVLDFDPATNRISTNSADELLSLIAEKDYIVTRILESHAHADHLTASSYLQGQLAHRGQPRAEICIGKRIKAVQGALNERYGINAAELDTAFDRLFDDNEEFSIGEIVVKVLYLPGHTPDHVGYMIGENVFTGDSIFNPDVGSARCDFPGGSASELYRSMRTLLSLPPHFRLYTGHDYPPEGREATENGVKEKAYTTVQEQNEQNKHVKAGVQESDFIKWRTERDSTLSAPRLLHQALQLNIRGGQLPPITADGYRSLLVPLVVPESFHGGK